jgi:integrase
MKSFQADCDKSQWSSMVPVKHRLGAGSMRHCGFRRRDVGHRAGSGRARHGKFAGAAGWQSAPTKSVVLFAAIRRARNVLGASEGARAARFICLTATFFRHGLRVAELSDLWWEQIEFKAAVLHVRRVKSGTPSTHPIQGDELRKLRRLQRESVASPIVFVSERGSPFTTAGFGNLALAGVTFLKSVAAACFWFAITGIYNAHSCILITWKIMKTVAARADHESAPRGVQILRRHGRAVGGRD